MKAHTLTDTAESNTMRETTSALSVPTPKPNNVNWSFKAPEPLQTDTASSADTSGTGGKSRGIGAQRSLQDNLLGSSFSPAQASPLGAAFSMQSTFQSTPPSQHPSDFTFHQVVSQTSALVSPLHPAALSGFQFGMGAFGSTAPNTPTGFSNTGRTGAGSGSASPFGLSPFGSADSVGGDNMFGMQRPASAGGMVRRLATPRGAKGFRKR
jgi:hypothetical protein